MRKFFYASVILNLLLIIFIGFVAVKYNCPSKPEKRVTGKLPVNAHYNALVNVFNNIPESKGGNVIIFLGDSITEFMYFDELLNLDGVKIKNRGIAGDTTEGILNRLDEITKAHAEKIFVLAGVNDIWNGADLNQSKKNYREIIKTLSQNSPESKIFIQSIVPVSESLNFPKDAIEDFNEELQRIAADFNCTYLNIYPLFLNQNGDAVDEKLFIDGIHMSGEGMKIWAEFLKDYVKD